MCAHVWRGRGDGGGAYVPVCVFVCVWVWVCVWGGGFYLRVTRIVKHRPTHTLSLSLSLSLTHTHTHTFDPRRDGALPGVANIFRVVISPQSRHSLAPSLA